MSTNHSAPVLNKQVGNLRPGSAGGKYKSKGTGETPRKNSPIMQKITALFKRERNTENGHVPVRPSCFADSPERRRSESPEPSGRKRAASHNTNKVWKAGKSEGAKGSGVGWRPKGRLEWESDSGRQITIGDVSVNELSKVEIQALQRLAITILQGMDIPVSHGLLKGSRNVLQRLSFNSFKQRKVNGAEKLSEGGVPGSSISNSGVFGQPLNQVVYQDQPIGKPLGCGTPVPTTPTSIAPYSLHYPTSTSPTSITSSEASFAADLEGNPTLLLEALNISPSYGSPKSLRRMSLCPAEPQVPSIVTKAISYLDSKGVKIEGLFRISGAKSRITEIRGKFDSGEDVELTDDMNPHDVACLLKEFFRSLPEPLMTVELFGPFLATRKLSNSAQQRDALRLLCLLLPQPNRDTLIELLQFLSRVALHSNGIILIDGTEEVGNRMTEQNLAMILGPNILHKEVKRKSLKPTDYQVQKMDPEELNHVCKVMEDLIRMQLSIFVIPAQLYESCLKSLLASDSAAVDMLLKRRCYDQGLFLEESPTRGFVSRSRSSDGLRKISQSSAGSGLTLEQELQEQEFMWQRNRGGLSDTQKVLDDAIRDLEEYIAGDLASLHSQRRYSSNDSAMGGSEVVVSPMQLDSTYSEPSTLYRKRQVHDSADSAFSNYSSPTNSSEGVHHSDILSVGSDMAVPCNHIRMSSEISNTSAASPVPRLEEDSPEPAAPGTSKAVPSKAPLSHVAASSMPVLGSERAVEPGRTHHTLPHTRRTLQPAQQLQEDSAKQVKNKIKHRTLPSRGLSNMGGGTYAHQRSPLLSPKDHHLSETQLDTVSSDHTPTESTSNITSSPSGFSLDSSHLQGTVI